MKKKVIKYILYVFLFLVFNVALFNIFLAQQKKPVISVNDPAISATSTLKATVGSRFMTPEEKKALNVNQNLRVEVLKRDASSTPTEYRIIK